MPQEVVLNYKFTGPVKNVLWNEMEMAQALCISLGELDRLSNCGVLCYHAILEGRRVYNAPAYNQNLVRMDRLRTAGWRFSVEQSSGMFRQWCVKWDGDTLSWHRDRPQAMAAAKSAAERKAAVIGGEVTEFENEFLVKGVER